MPGLRSQRQRGAGVGSMIALDLSLPVCEWRPECDRWSRGLVFVTGMGEVPVCEACAAEFGAHLIRVPSWVRRTYAADLAKRRADQGWPGRAAA
ncbi:hypothetical protein CGZ94_20205 [Enemella evansiae]|uniref:Uncharacterized protein n=1 Tax=Enemella evansiae TaxID=2016499 RepID=A0A255FZT4_9ACTN|nr:hypothetical protein CGZ94_20205 [Enemella evansiae]